MFLILADKKALEHARKSVMLMRCDANDIYIYHIFAKIYVNAIKRGFGSLTYNKTKTNKIAIMWLDFARLRVMWYYQIACGTCLCEHLPPPLTTASPCWRRESKSERLVYYRLILCRIATGDRCMFTNCRASWEYGICSGLGAAGWVALWSVLFDQQPTWYTLWQVVYAPMAYGMANIYIYIYIYSMPLIIPRSHSEMSNGCLIDVDLASLDFGKCSHIFSHAAYILAIDPYSPVFLHGHRGNCASRFLMALHQLDQRLGTTKDNQFLSRVHNFWYGVTNQILALCIISPWSQKLMQWGQSMCMKRATAWHEESGMLLNLFLHYNWYPCMQVHGNDGISFRLDGTPPNLNVRE